MSWLCPLSDSIVATACAETFNHGRLIENSVEIYHIDTSRDIEWACYDLEIESRSEQWESACAFGVIVSVFFSSIDNIWKGQTSMTEIKGDMQVHSLSGIWAKDQIINVTRLTVPVPINLSIRMSSPWSISFKMGGGRSQLWLSRDQGWFLCNGGWMENW